MAKVRFWQDEIGSYLADIADSKPLSSEREKELAKRIKEGDTEARNELVKANLLFVIWVAKKYQNRGLPIADLVSAGNEGLIIAAERFDGEKNFRFISYAVWWIRQAIMQTLGEQTRTVRLPTNRIDLLVKINEMEEDLLQDGVEAPSLEDFAAALGVKVDEIRETLLLAGRNTVSLDSGFESGKNERNLLDTLPDDGESPDELSERNDLIGIISEELSHLDDRSERILRLYFGLGGADPLALEEIGVMFGLTRERVRQLKEKALHKLRQYRNGRLAVYACEEEKKRFDYHSDKKGKANGCANPPSNQINGRQNRVNLLARKPCRCFGHDTANSILADYGFYVRVFGKEPPSGELASIYGLTEKEVEEILKLARERKK